MGFREETSGEFGVSVILDLTRFTFENLVSCGNTTVLTSNYLQFIKFQVILYQITKAEWFNHYSLINGAPDEDHT